MPSSAYREILVRIRRLPSADQLRLLEELAALIRAEMTIGFQHSILEFEGLGKAIWDGVDAREYVDRERASWGSM